MNAMNHTHYETQQGVAVIRLNNAPVNGLSHAVRKSIVAGIRQAEADASVTAIVIIGSQSLFSGGADMREFGTAAVTAEPNLLNVISIVETSTKPVVAALGGTCMGGGLELALGCHFRIAVSGAQLALPEVKIGLLPGAGGTQRLPRIIGVEAALNMIVSGETVPSDLLKATPRFDEFIEGDLLAGAIAFANKVVAEKRALKRVRDLTVSHPKPDAFFMFARNSVGSVSKNYPAPLKCVEAVQACLTQSFEEGMQTEARLFGELYLGNESQALRHLFLSERRASKVEGVSPEARVVMLDDSILAEIEREREGNGRGGKAGRGDIPTPAEMDDDEYERQRRRLLRDVEEDGGADGGGVGRRRTGRRSPSDVRLFRDADTAAVDA